MDKERALRAFCSVSYKIIRAVGVIAVVLLDAILEGDAKSRRRKGSKRYKNRR